MKAFARLFLLAAFVAAPAWLVWRGAAVREHEHGSEEHAEAPEAEPGVVKLDAEAREHAGLEIAPLAAATLGSEASAWGRVLDPAPLAALDDELAAAEAAIEVSRAASTRAQSLFQGGENVARKTVESTESQLRADEIKRSGLRRRIALEWGASLAALDAKARHDLVEQLVAGAAALVRVELPAGERLAAVPKSARLAVLDGEPVAAQEIFAAATADPKTQSQAFIVRAAAPSLRPGMAVTAWLDAGGEARTGALVPREAVVRFDGRTWIYVPAKSGAGPAKGGEFERRAIALGAPLEAGYFAAELRAGEKIVVRGAQSLLSHEARALGGAEEE